MRSSSREVPTPHGPGRLHRAGASPSGRATLVLGHGAGGGVEAADLRAMAAAVSEAGYAVVLVEQPWRVAGRGIAPRPAVLDEAWLACVRSLRPRGPLVLGGRSAGARVACRTASELDAAAVVTLAFPLHPPGRPERSRAGEMAGCPVPVLAIQGDRDVFGTARDLRREVPSARVVEVSGGDHGLGRGDVGPAVEAVISLLDRLSGECGPGHAR